MMKTREKMKMENKEFEQELEETKNLYERLYAFESMDEEEFNKHRKDFMIFLSDILKHITSSKLTKLLQMYCIL